MEGFFVAILTILMVSCFAYYQGINQGIEDVITNKGACIETKIQGVEFKKCYELKEMDISK